MKNSVVLLIAIGVFWGSSCNMRLSKEEQKAFQQEEKERTIVKVTEEMIFEEVQNQVDTLLQIYNEKGSLPKSNVYTMKFLKNSGFINSQEKEIYEAYLAAIEQGTIPPNNLQKIADGQYLYCIPQIEKDSTEHNILIGVYYLNFVKKEIIKKISLR